MPANNPKRHHFLPRFYLEHFADGEGKFYVFDINRKELRRATPKTTAVRKHYYTAEDLDGNTTVIMEELFSELEGMAAPIFKKIAGGALPDERERLRLAFFLGQQVFRVPSFENQLNRHLTDWARIIEEKNSEEADCNDCGHESTALEAALANTGLKANAGMRLRVGAGAADQLSEKIWKSSWIFIRAGEQQRFVLGDSSSGFCKNMSVKIRGFRDPYRTPHGERCHLFPISETTCLLVVGQGLEQWDARVTDGGVRQINAAIAKESHEILVSSSKTLLEGMVRRAERENWRRSVPKLRSQPHPSGDPMRGVVEFGTRSEGWLENGTKRSIC